MIIDETARLHEAGERQCLRRDHGAGAERETIRHTVGLMHDGCAQLEFGITDADEVAGMDTEPRQQIGFDRETGMAVAYRQRNVKRHRRIEVHYAVKRIGIIDGFKFDQRLTAPIGARRPAIRGAAGHRAHLRRH